MANIILIGKPISVNSLYRGRRFLTNAGKKIKNDYYCQALLQYGGEMMLGDVCISMKVYFKSKKASDLDNVLKATLDSLTGVIWKDDRQIVDIRAVKLQDKLNPRIELEIYEETKS